MIQRSEYHAMRRSLLLVTVLCSTLFLAAHVAYAKTASNDDRMRMSQAVANYIHSNDRSAGTFKNARAVQIGAAVVSWPGAIADWQSSDGKSRGQVSFYFACDHWNVQRVSNGTALKPQDVMIDHNMFGGVSRKTATQLIAELNTLRARQVAYLKPARAGHSC